MQIRFGILTLSDRSARGERQDESGPALASYILAENCVLTRSLILPDDESSIRETLIQWADSNEFDVILTTGSTGFAPRDVAPEATRAVIQKEAQGLTEFMRAESLRKTKHAILSRAVAGIRGKTLIINLPGSPKAAVENLSFIFSVLPHAVQLLRDEPDVEAGH